MSGWTTPTLSFPSNTALYRAFHPDDPTGLARLIELIVFLRQGPMSISCLVEIIQDISDGVQHADITTFIQRNCQNLSFLVLGGIVKCKYLNR